MGVITNPTYKMDLFLFQVIQAVTFLSPIVGGHQPPLFQGHVFTQHPKKVMFAELPGW